MNTTAQTNPTWHGTSKESRDPVPFPWSNNSSIDVLLDKLKLYLDVTILKLEVYIHAVKLRFLLMVIYYWIALFLKQVYDMLSCK